MKLQVIIFIYLGGSILHFVKCYSSGNFDHIPVICQTMAVDHYNIQPQETEPPFKVDPDNITIGPEDVGKPIDVTLNADKDQTFKGFMLEARKPGDTTPQGIFVLTNPDLTRLQKCNGANGKAVTQTDNRKKTEIKVIWSASERGIYFFRATFVKDLNIFWLFKDVPSTTLAPPTTTTTIIISTSTSDVPSTTLAPPTTTTSIMISTSTSDVPSTTLAPPTTTTSIMISTSTSDSKPAPKEGLPELYLSQHLISYLSLVVCSPFLLKASVCVWMKVTSFLSLVFSLSAFILSVIHTKQVVGKILAGAAVSLNLGQTILIFFLCRPSHKLRTIFLWVLKVVAFINLCFTIAAIYFGLVELYSKNFCILPSILMGVYLACHLMSFAFFIYGNLKQKNQHQTASSRQICKASCWCSCLVIFSLMSIAFTIALELALFLCD
ncbi:uncharacterized protein LOC132854096 isoform X6 [Tachysurus vachellii]|uniref:uncharacterized protein LOC132854096 isoform X5 n=1 Tax=Tachysurus vachellii TaxID=175792 RepID=UPI00296AF133|nr:uncharacterized protein LOC132854096 isoform X5 [Tachysurus vachellii]XP_060738243.1 uncharacterized protein LOC132854096 isoform X6 [Tachysurus vachellii]